jgi:hypothetical protein
MPSSQPTLPRGSLAMYMASPGRCSALPHPPPRDVLLRRQGQRQVKQHAQLGVVAAQAAHAVPPLPRVRRVVRACAHSAVGALRPPPACPKRPAVTATTAHAPWRTWACPARLCGVAGSPHAQSTHPSAACRRAVQGGTQPCWREQVMVRRLARRRQAGPTGAPVWPHRAARPPGQCKRTVHRLRRRVGAARGGQGDADPERHAAQAQHHLRAREAHEFISACSLALVCQCPAQRLPGQARHIQSEQMRRADIHAPLTRLANKPRWDAA